LLRNSQRQVEGQPGQPAPLFLRLSDGPFKQGAFSPIQVKCHIEGGLFKALVQAVRPEHITADPDPGLAALLVKKTAIDDRNLFAAVVYMDAVPTLGTMAKLCHSDGRFPHHCRFTKGNKHSHKTVEKYSH
jgi:hypothetical protein